MHVNNNFISLYAKLPAKGKKIKQAPNGSKAENFTFLSNFLKFCHKNKRFL